MNITLMPGLSREEELEGRMSTDRRKLQWIKDCRLRDME